jgi:hypothetical protein
VSKRSIWLLLGPPSALVRRQVTQAKSPHYRFVASFYRWPGVSMRTAFGQSRFEGSLGSLNLSETSPEPSAGATAGSAGHWLPNQYEAIDEGHVIQCPACDALVAMDAPWRGTFRDAGLLLLGIFVSLVVEFA